MVYHLEHERSKIQNFHNSKQLGDSVGESTARMNVSDLRKMLGLPDAPMEADSLSDIRSTADSDDAVSQTRSSNSSSRHFRVRRQSMEQLDLIKVFSFVFPFRFCFVDHHPQII